MPILNYTTTISAEKTASEIQVKLAKSGAQAVLCEYDENGIMCAMSFRVKTPHGMMFFRLPAHLDGVYRALCKNNKVPKRSKSREQAAKVAWRILKDWIEAQLAIIDAEMAEMAEVFLPYAQGEAGKTLYSLMVDTGFPLLTHDC
jgi:hypothetical protein